MGEWMMKECWIDKCINYKPIHRLMADWWMVNGWIDKWMINTFVNGWLKNVEWINGWLINGWMDDFWMADWWMLNG